MYAFVHGRLVLEDWYWKTFDLNICDGRHVCTVVAIGKLTSAVL